MKNTKIVTALVILIIVGFLAAVVWGSKSKKEKTLSSANSQIENETATPVSDSSDGLIFYYGVFCPHCKEVEEWMEQNKIEEKVKIVKKEVYNNQGNARELEEAARNCGMGGESIGVPFLVTEEKKCLVGSVEIINFLKERVGL